MGINLDQIVGDLGHSNFSCSICTDLLEDAITLRECEHSFCRGCIDNVIATSKGCCETLRCPDCRTKFKAKKDVNKPSRFMRNMLSEIKLKCPFDVCKGGL